MNYIQSCLQSNYLHTRQTQWKTQLTTTTAKANFQSLENSAQQRPQHDGNWHQP